MTDSTVQVTAEDRAREVLAEELDAANYETRARWLRAHEDEASPFDLPVAPVIRAMLAFAASRATLSADREGIARALWFDHVDQAGYPNGFPTWDEMLDDQTPSPEIERFRSYADAIIALLSSSPVVGER